MVFASPNNAMAIIKCPVGFEPINGTSCGKAPAPKPCSKSNPLNCDATTCKKAGGTWKSSTCSFAATSSPDVYAACDQLKGAQKTTCEKEQAALKNDANTAETAKSCGTDPNCQEIFTYLINAVQVLSAVVGIVVVAMIIYGGIEYSSSAGNPEKAASAKNHITNALFALVAFFFLWAFLNFLIPGGVFHG